MFTPLNLAAITAAAFLASFAPGRRPRNLGLLAASCLFYAAWDWRFLPLLFVSAGTDYLCALGMRASSDDSVRKRLLLTSLAVNLSILGFFKYFNFFAAGLADLLGTFGFHASAPALDLVLPLGISFYTFRTLSYTLDVYSGRLEATDDFLDYALFVTFFPLIAAGPIVRAADLLPQLSRAGGRRPGWAGEGLHLVFWGVFEKVFIADNLARISGPVFSGGEAAGAAALAGVYAFAFQLYFDFDGYSNIAKGVCRLLGFDIADNFRLPYLSSNAVEFWERWHISLSSWLRDYVFMPAAMAMRGFGNRSAAAAALLTFTLCGLWHGAAWTFVLWGAYHGALAAGYRLARPHLALLPKPGGAAAAPLRRALAVLVFFHALCLGWVLFRAGSVSSAFSVLRALASAGSAPAAGTFMKLAFFLAVPAAAQFWQAKRGDLMAVYRAPVPARAAFYFLCSCLLVIFGAKEAQEFIYFQF
ncbi:MAG TPA: MBOAT family O-acyltransferase [Elusimicrobiales bacterium]|nr:MBOAT family O-acyltransferase [Elusimicrobiales bacterium]